MSSCRIRFSWKSEEIYFLTRLDPKALSNSTPGYSVLIDKPAVEVQEKIIFLSTLDLLDNKIWVISISKGIKLTIQA